LSIGQDVVLGNYYLTYEKTSAKNKPIKAYSSVYEAEMAYDNGKLQLQSPIRVYFRGQIRETTLGRVFFNDVLPEDFHSITQFKPKSNLKKFWLKFSMIMAQKLQL